MRDFNIDGVERGKPYQEVYEQSEVQKYPIGTILERHGKRFRYCQALENITATHQAQANRSKHGGDTNGDVWAVMGTIGTKAEKGQTSVLMANVGTGSVDTIFPLDWFYNGTINFYVPHADYTDLLSMRISGSDVATASSVRIYLDGPLPCNIAATVFAEAHPSPYKNVGTGGGPLYSLVAVNYVELTAGYYFWGQTKGLCYVVRNVGVCSTGRVKVFTDGSGIIEDAGVNDIRQVAGYTQTPNVSDGMLQLMLE